ncbi:MAG TPA: dolichyl-phosphate beta-glucosyltransferase [Pyrinomonadaceae bacterium]|jgi:glycosyltransferase involved in cell wall biosynthesis|nr:dolichyl-phosphate beta-glucosyltransferase [Pyrinomonadaceae bacterium]
MSASLSVVIPAYNEVARLGNTLTAVVNYLRQSWPDGEVIVVDDGSTDNTASLAREVLNDTAGAQNNGGAREGGDSTGNSRNSGGLRTSVITYKSNLGKGRAVRLGLLAARSDVALFSDADLSTPITEAPKLVEPILSGQFDVTFGSRALDRALIGVHQPWRREQGGRVFNLVVRLATGLPFWDTQCGFKAFRMSACRPLVEAATVDRFGFDVELLYLAFRAGLRLKEVPVRWDHNEGSTVSLASDSFRMLSEVGLIRQQARRGVYDDAIRAVHEIENK